MKLSQFDTKVSAFLMATVLFTAHFAVAADSTQSVADKKRPASKASTLSKPSQQSLQKGGFSDGGGNVVKGDLFDFYENKGSTESSVDKFIALEPRAAEVLAYLNSQIPAVRYADSGGFSDILKNELGKKDVIIEKKAITSKACLNSSLVSTSSQSVAACQDHLELRVNPSELNSIQTANGRAGLIVHELLLAWAQANFDLEKDILEKKVRQMNREIFNSFSQKIDLANSLGEIFNVKAYNPDRFAKAKALNSLRISTYKSFCAKPSTGLSSAWNAYLQDDFFAQDIPGSIEGIRNISDVVKSGESLESVQESVASVCENYTIDNTPIRAADMDLIPDACVRHLNSAAEGIIRIQKLKNSDELSEGEKDSLLYGAMSVVKMSANTCAGIRGIQLEKKLFMTVEKGHRMMQETRMEAFVYVRHALKRAGYSVSFMNDF